MYTVSGKKSPSFIICNFNKFQNMLIIFDKNYSDTSLFKLTYIKFTPKIYVSLSIADVIMTNDVIENAAFGRR